MLALVSVNAIHAEDWPQFLGPQRNGISSEKGLISTFGEKGPEVRWRTDLGVGMSGIVVAKQIAVTMYQDSQHQYVVAIHVESGNLLWKSPIAPSYTNPMGDGPRSTPAVEGDRVYAFSGEGRLACFALKDGQEVWNTNPTQELGAKPAEYGMACSPLLTDEHVVVTIGAQQATVIGVAKNSGQIAWKAGKGNPAGYSSPALLKTNKGVQLVAFHGAGALGLTPDAGKELWTYVYITDYDCNIATPISVGNSVLLSAGENHGTVLLDVPDSSNGEAKEVWKTFGNRANMRNEWQTSILIDGYLYGFDNVGSAGPVTHLVCLNSKDGNIVWQKKRFGKGNMIAADGKLWCSNMDGELIIVQATREKFVELDRASLIGQTRQAPTLCNGFIYLRDNAEIISIDVREKD